jgi:hypothetical protein
MIKIAKGLGVATIAISALNAMPLQAEIYKYTDENGKSVFSDRPPAQSQSGSVLEVEVGPTNLSNPPPNIPKPIKESSDPELSVTYSTTITSPSEGTTVPMGPGDFVVAARLSPPMEAGEFALLEIDGAAIGEPQKDNIWQLRNINRGEHQITIKRQTAAGKVLDVSASVAVYVLRPSIR